MIRRLVPVALCCFVAAAASASADQGPRRIFEIEGYVPAVAVADRGYGVVFWDWSDDDETNPYGHAKFLRLDDAGAPTGPGRRITLDMRFSYPADTMSELIAVRSGFVYFGQLDAFALHTVSLDDAGVQRGPSHELVTSDELYWASAVQGSAGIVLSYPEWYGNWIVWSQAVQDDGTADGPRRIAGSVESGGGRSTPGDAFVSDSSLACDGNDCVVAWARYGIGIQVRDLDSKGRPTAPLADLGLAAEFNDAVSVASIGGMEAIVYSTGTGNGPKDLFLATRRKDGTLRGPFPISAEPADEGEPDWGNDFFRPIRVVAAGDRIGVLWLQDDPLRPGSDVRWIFREFDLDGAPIGDRRDLHDEFEMFPFTQPDIKWDGAHRRYVLVWCGWGPEGYGTYWLALDPSPLASP